MPFGSTPISLFTQNLVALLDIIIYPPGSKGIYLLALSLDASLFLNYNSQAKGKEW